MALGFSAGGCTPAFAELGWMDVELAGKLLGCGADPNGCGEDPLHLAARGRHSDAVAVLLRYGADPDHSSRWHSSAREVILQEGSDPMRAALFEADRNWRSRRLTASSVRRRAGWESGRWDWPDPVPTRIRGETVWVFDGGLAWNWKWGLATGGRVRYYASLRECLARLEA